MKYLTRTDLLQINRNAIDQNRNRALYQTRIRKYSAKSVFPVIGAMIHTNLEGEEHVRTYLEFPDGKWGALDMTPWEFETLPESED